MYWSCQTQNEPLSQDFHLPISLGSLQQKSQESMSGKVRVSFSSVRQILKDRAIESVLLLTERPH
jgi:hypothetical protein